MITIVAFIAGVAVGTAFGAVILDRIRTVKPNF